MNKFQTIYNHLKSNGFDVYSPQQKTDECIRPYVVVKSTGTSEVIQVTSNRALFDIMCFVPRDQYSTLEDFVKSVESTMDEMFPLLRPTHYKTPSFYDDAVKAHMISVQYQNYQKKVRY